MAHRNNNKMTIATLSLASILGIASLGQAHAAEWSSIGAVGQVESSAAAIARTTKDMITMKGPGSLVVRYSVPPSAELAAGTGTLNLMANLSDPGAGTSVDVFLVADPIDGPGGSTTSPSSRFMPLHLSSSDSDAVSNFTTRCVATPSNTAFKFDFEKNVYYIHAVLSAADQLSAPALRALKLQFSDGALTHCVSSQ